jgi:CAAX prenyl protease-like protein
MFPAAPLLRYLTPFAAFLLLSFLQGTVEGTTFWWMYAAKILAVAALIALLFRGYWQEIPGKFDWRAVAVGLGVLALWLVNYHLFYDTAQSPGAFDASSQILLLKILGSSLIIPVIEELFFRSFLMRYLVQSDFLSVPLGRYTAFSFWVTAIVFAAMHPAWQWGAALAAGAAYGAYLVKTKNLVGCILAHATTNFGLALYIIATGEWALWM